MTIGDVLLFPRDKASLETLLQQEAFKRYEISLLRDKDGRTLDPDLFGPDILGREAAHSDQWSHYRNVGDFAVSDAAWQLDSIQRCGAPGVCDKFELTANPFKGGYWKAPVLVNGEFLPAPGHTESQSCREDHVVGASVGENC